MRCVGVVFVSVWYIFATRVVWGRNHVPCSDSENKIPLHIRAIPTRDTEEHAHSNGLLVQTAVDHINGMTGILDEYHLCYRFDIAHVSTFSCIMMIIVTTGFNVPGGSKNEPYFTNGAINVMCVRWGVCIIGDLWELRE